jgi:hypothetical protein
MPDPVKVVGLFLPIPILFAVGEQYIWMWFFLGVGAILGLAEGYSYLTKDKSISQRFWEWDNKKLKIAIVSAWMLFASYLSAHLLLKW